MTDDEFETLAYKWSVLDKKRKEMKRELDRTNRLGHVMRALTEEMDARGVTRVQCQFGEVRRTQLNCYEVVDKAAFLRWVLDDVEERWHELAVAIAHKGDLMYPYRPRPVDSPMYDPLLREMEQDRLPGTVVRGVPGVMYSDKTENTP